MFAVCCPISIVQSIRFKKRYLKATSDSFEIILSSQWLKPISINPSITISFPITFTNIIFSVLLSEASFTPANDREYNDSYFGSNMVKQDKEKIIVTSNRFGNTTSANLCIGC